MVVKCIINGVKVHGPPYTKAEEADFYRRTGNGPITMFAPREKKAPEPPAISRPRRAIAPAEQVAASWEVTARPGTPVLRAIRGTTNARRAFGPPRSTSWSARPVI